MPPQDRFSSCLELTWRPRIRQEQDRAAAPRAAARCVRLLTDGSHCRKGRRAELLVKEEGGVGRGGGSGGDGGGKREGEGEEGQDSEIMRVSQSSSLNAEHSSL